MPCWNKDQPRALPTFSASRRSNRNSSRRVVASNNNSVKIINSVVSIPRTIMADWYDLLAIIVLALEVEVLEEAAVLVTVESVDSVAVEGAIIRHEGDMALPIAVTVHRQAVIEEDREVRHHPPIEEERGAK